MELYKIAASKLHGIGIQTLKQLYERMGNLNILFEEDISVLAKRYGVNKKRLTQMNRNHAIAEAQKQLEFNKKFGIQTLFFDDAKYPHLLKECSDAPITLYYKGNKPIQGRLVSVVGTRRASSYGKQMVEKLISSFENQEVIIISGLASGIDTYVHECCLEYNIQTIGVLGHGLNTIYPKMNRNLAGKMTRNGGLLTEFGIDHQITKYSFPKRNRIIAGMSQATIVIESPKYGGAIITAEIANGYNREVMAVPGSVFSNLSEGCNELIKKNKAHLLENTADFFELMNWEKTSKNNETKIQLTQNESVIVNLLDREEGIHFDKLVALSKFSVSQLHGLILNLELKQIIRALPGSIFKLDQPITQSDMV